MQLFDCTLRDGGNVLGNGFPRELTTMMLEGLLANNIRLIEFGNAYGIGAYEADGKTAPMTDAEYLELAQPYLARGEIGMFVGVKNAVERNVALAAEKGLKFLRLGANAGDGASTKEGIALIRKYGMTPHYSLMKGYILGAKELAAEAKMLEGWGLGAITIMDSAGTMAPVEVEEYVTELVQAVSIPVGFHGHNNLGLSVANAIAAEKSGAAILDCGLMGMARSAGNLATELAVAVFHRMGKEKTVNFMGLLEFIDSQLAPTMKKHGYTASVTPEDLVLGYSGCHSNFLELFREVAKSAGVNLYQLIIEVSAKNRKNPSRKEMEEFAEKLAKT